MRYNARLATIAAVDSGKGLITHVPGKIIPSYPSKRDFKEQAIRFKRIAKAVSEKERKYFSEGDNFERVFQQHTKKIEVKPLIVEYMKHDARVEKLFGGKELFNRTFIKVQKRKYYRGTGRVLPDFYKVLLKYEQDEIIRKLNEIALRTNKKRERLFLVKMLDRKRRGIVYPHGYTADSFSEDQKQRIRKFHKAAIRKMTAQKRRIEKNILRYGKPKPTADDKKNIRNYKKLVREAHKRAEKPKKQKKKVLDDDERKARAKAAQQKYRENNREKKRECAKLAMRKRRQLIKQTKSRSENTALTPEISNRSQLELTSTQLRTTKTNISKFSILDRKPKMALYNVVDLPVKSRYVNSKLGIVRPKVIKTNIEFQDELRKKSQIKQRRNARKI